MAVWHKYTRQPNLDGFQIPPQAPLEQALQGYPSPHKRIRTWLNRLLQSYEKRRTSMAKHSFSESSKSIYSRGTSWKLIPKNELNEHLFRPK